MGSYRVWERRSRRAFRGLQDAIEILKRRKGDEREPLQAIEGEVLIRLQHVRPRQNWLNRPILTKTSLLRWWDGWRISTGACHEQREVEVRVASCAGSRGSIHLKTKSGRVSGRRISAMHRSSTRIHLYRKGSIPTLREVVERALDSGIPKQCKRSTHRGSRDRFGGDGCGQFCSFWRCSPRAVRTPGEFSLSRICW